MKKTEEILNDISIVGEIGKLVINGEVMDELAELKTKIVKNKFYIVVAGLFKRGKSSIINALVGRPVAPVAVTPLTAIITFFEHAENDLVEVIFENGTRKAIGVNEIKSYVAEEENPENIKKVSLIKVSLSDSELLKKCCLVDTPGLGSVFDHNSETTYNYIPKIDAALFVLGADVPIAKVDVDFLKEINATVPRIVYVMNKTDLQDEPDLRRIIEFNRKIIAETTREPEEDIVIVPVSCRKESEKPGSGNLNQLLGLLTNLIETEKQSILLETSHNRLLSIAGEIRRLLIVRAETLQMPVKEIEEKQARLRNSVALMNDTRDEFDILIKGQVNRILERKSAKIDEQVKLLLSHFKTEINEKFKNGNLTDREIVEFHGNLTSQALNSLEIIKNESEQNIRDEFRQLMENYQNRSQSYLNEFSKLLADMFGADFEMITSPFNLDAYSSFYFLNYVHGRSKEVKLGLFFKFMPKWAKQSRYKSIIVDNIDALLEVNCNRMKSDITYKVTESFRKFTSNSREQMGKLFDKIDKMLTEAKTKKEKTKEEIADNYAILKNNISKLEKIQKISV